MGFHSNKTAGKPMKTDSHPVSDPRQNHLLAALQPADWARWLEHLQPVTLSQGQVLNEPDRLPSSVIFPTTAICSLLLLTEEGSCTEVAVIGNDGAVGVAQVLGGGDGMPSDAVVQSAGQGLRVSARFIKSEMERGGAVLMLLLRYTLDVIAQVAQTAMCNRYHSIDQQLCRRLLMGLDRLPGDEMDLTQEGAAHLLGVRREGVTGVAHKLQEAGLIRYSRGHIVVLDRERLEQRTCECYAVGKKAFGRLLAPELAA
jgi:CRP-like cAMP-binding protein